MGMKFEYEGTTYNVPCMPKKEWGEWMTDNSGCRVPNKEGVILCGYKICPLPDKCIYRFHNWEARKAFYFECFPEEKPTEKPSCEECANYKPKEELPKLTQEVFEREDCPEWAKWAAVDEDGKAAWFERRPTVYLYQWDDSQPGESFVWIEGSLFDATDWEHSLIERDIKPQYKILEHKDRDSLEGLVNSYLKQGWKLKGAATKSRDKYMQTVVKEN